MNSQPLIEAEVLAQIRLGDKEALVRLYEEYCGLVFGIAIRVLRNRAAAEDVVQDVFLQLWRNPAAFDAQRGRLAPWLAVITRHKAVDALRKSKHERPSEENLVSDVPQPHVPLHLVADADKARRLMALLPVEQKLVLELAYLDGLTHMEIAQKIGEPLGTVKSRIRLGLLTLRKELGV